MKKILLRFIILCDETFEKNYTIEYFTECKETQLKKIIINWNKEINHGVIIDFKEIEDFFKLNPEYLKEKASVYLSIGKYLEKNKRFIEANYYYNQLLDETLFEFNKSIFYILLLKIFRNNYVLKNFSRTIYLFKVYKNSISNYKSDLEIYLNYNIALAYMEIGSYSQALLIFKKCESISSKTEINYRIKNNIAFCLQKLSKYDEARLQWKNIIFEFSNYHNKVLDAIINIGKCSIEDNNIFIMEKSLKQIQDYKKNNNITKLRFKRNYTIGNIYEKLNLIDESILFYEDEIKLGFLLKNKDFDSKIYFESFNKLLTHYKIYQVDKILILYNYFLQIPTDFIEVKTTHKLINLLISINKIELVLKINEKFIN